MADEQAPQGRFQSIRDERLSEIADLKEEVGAVYAELVKPRWEVAPRHFSRTLYAFVMATLSFVDLLSTYGPADNESQTTRMRQFFVDYFNADEETATVVVKLWRHTLMHTANPQALVSSSSGIRYRWLLHWEAELPRPQHLTLTSAGNAERILNLALAYLVEDLECAAGRLFDDAARSEAGRRRLIAADESARRATF